MAYPDGGWQRAGSYVWHRLRRLPDRPERIAKGIAAGVMVSFLPIFGVSLSVGGGLGLGIARQYLGGAFGHVLRQSVHLPTYRGRRHGNWQPHSGAGAYGHTAPGDVGLQECLDRNHGQSFMR